LPRSPHGTSRERGVPGRLFVDSGAWLALVSARDQHHAEADTAFRTALAQRAALFTTNLILAEVHRLLLFRAGPRAAASALVRFESSDRLTIVFATEAHHRAAHAWLDRLGDQEISYTDAVSFAVMAATRCAAALSFDRDFEIAGFPLWRVG